MRNVIIRATPVGFVVQAEIGGVKRVCQCPIPDKYFIQAGYSAAFHDTPDWEAIRRLVAVDLMNAIFTLQEDSLWDSEGKFVG